MPSAAKQKIPADLWHYRHGRYSPGQCVSASPGQGDIFNEEKKHQQFRSTPKKAQGFQKNQRPSGVRATACSHELRVMAAKDVTVNALPVSIEPRESISKDIKSASQKVPDAFALDAALPPHPSELPLPPIEWLKPTSQSPLTVGRSLQAILSCQVAA